MRSGIEATPGGASPNQRIRPPGEPCLNCGDMTTGAFCPTCGQRKTNVRVSVRALLADVLEDQLAVNRTLPRTLVALLFQPGLLTQEYVRGRIVRYIAPFRLYLVASVVFFLIVSFIGMRAIDNVQVTVQPTAASDSADALPPEPVADSAVAPGELSPPAVTEAPLPPGTLQPWAQQIQLDLGDGWLDNALQRRIQEVGHLPGREAGRRILEDLLTYAPQMVFLLLPVFALLLELLYLRRRRYYAEHFVFALHVHAFVFVMMTLMFLLPWNLFDRLALVWIAAYIWLAMKRVYGQGWVRTTLKWWTLGWLYSFTLLFGLLALAAATLVLT